MLVCKLSEKELRAPVCHLPRRQLLLRLQRLSPAVPRLAVCQLALRALCEFPLLHPRHRRGRALLQLFRSVARPLPRERCHDPMSLLR